MSPGFRSPRRAILLVPVTLLALVFLSMTRPGSRAQEPAKPVNGNAIREKIIALQAEIEVLEVEHESSRIVFADCLKEERAILAKFESYVDPSFLESRKGVISISMNGQGDPDEKPLEQFLSWGGDVLASLVWVESISDDELRKKLLDAPEDVKAEEFLKPLGRDIAKDLESLTKKTKGEFTEARARLAEVVRARIQTKATTSVRVKIARSGKEFSRQASELAAKRLDLAALERQYGESH